MGDIARFVSDEKKPSVLAALASDQNLGADRRLAAQLRIITDTQQALELLPQLIGHSLNLKACVNILVKKESKDKLLNVVLRREFNSSARLLALRGLRALKAHDELKRVVETEDVPYRIRRMAAEALYNSPLDVDTASMLLRFFDAQRNHGHSRLLERRAFVNYILGQNEEAIKLLDQLFTVREKSAWALGVYAHCLQRLGRLDESLTKYTEALELKPHASFERCQRAFIYWTRDDLDRALEDVEQSKCYSVPKWFQPYGAEILCSGGRLKEAQIWLDTAVKDYPGSDGLPLLLRGLFSFDQGRVSKSMTDFRALPTFATLPNVLDWFYLEKRHKMARAMRVLGAFDEAIAEYSSRIDRMLLQDHLRAERAETQLRKRAFAEADNEISELRTQGPEWAFIMYLEGLSGCFRGNAETLHHAAARALALTPDDTNSEHLSDRALYAFAIEDSDAAERMLSKLVADRRLDQLRYGTVFGLDTLAQALPSRVDIALARERMKKIAWPEGWEVELDPRSMALRAIQRQKYPFPMYCQLSGIAGLENDRQLAERVLNLNKSDERSIVLWNLDRANRIYGQCNFKKDRDADYDLKFCDSIDQTISKNLTIFVREFGVRRLLFLEEELFNKFRLVASAKRLPIKCQLVEAL